jgi:hypothetical protein
MHLPGRSGVQRDAGGRAFDEHGEIAAACDPHDRKFAAPLSKRDGLLDLRRREALLCSEGNANQADCRREEHTRVNGSRG